jgi:hypothetical protein
VYNDFKKDALDDTLWESGFGSAYVIDEEYRLQLIYIVIVNVLCTRYT